MGMAANGAKYGMLTNHFYWVGAIPAMVFLAIFMMPFYYGSRVRSVPEYLKLRFDERTRGLNAISFALMTIAMSGINMYAMALVMNLMLGWNVHASIVLSAAVVLVYIFFGGLTSSIYNEVIQFFLIVFGLLPMAILGLTEVGGFDGLAARLPEGFVHTWSVLGDPSSNPMGVGFVGTILGLGFVLSFGYWCTDFLVVQRALASKDLASARRTPIIAAVPKMLFPLLVILPGLVALATIPEEVSDNYNMSFPLMLARYYPPGLLGLGLTALVASFMSGMAGNVTAFNTVWTYDIYQAYLRPGSSDRHYLAVGRAATIFGILASVGAAYLVFFFNNLMDYMQLLFSFFNAPLFATFLLGMFWARATAAGAFFGLLAGTAAAAAHYLLGVAGILSYRSDMASNYFGAITAWTVCFFVTIAVSLMTRPRPIEELSGLVYTATPRELRSSSPVFLSLVVLAGAVVLNVWFW
jgi:SSS family solute:Na+ symporter